MKISACLITLNEEQNLPRCLRSVAPLVDEIVVIDSGSTDRTLEIAAKFKARIVPQPWLGYVGQKNFALQEAHFPWVLSIDADEEISDELAESILILKNAAPESPEGTMPAGYLVSRLVQYRGRWIFHGDWYPDKLVRLFQRDLSRFSGGRVHERLEVQGDIAPLAGHLHHFTYSSAADRRARIVKYATLWAETQWERGKSAAPWSGPLHALVRLLRGFILKRGFLDGPLGWDIALGNAREVWLKYSLLRKFTCERQSS